MASVDHVIVLALAGRSFDHMLGFLPHPDPAFDGLRGRAFTNGGWRGAPAVAASPNAKRVLPGEPDHSHAGVMEQLALQGAGMDKRPTNRGFVVSYERKLRGQGKVSGRGPLIMLCQPPQHVPVLSRLALSFTVCTRWFCSVPGDAWPNRNFMHAATSDGNSSVELRPYTNRTIFELLEDHRATWHIYHADTPQAWAFPALWDTPERHANWFPLTAFEEHVAAGRLPSYSFIEPNHRPPRHTLDHAPVSGAPDVSNSQHPGNNLVTNVGYDNFPDDADTDFARAETLIATIYEALRTHPEVFERALLLITYDEHGGFYDHVPPPTGVPGPGGPSRRSFDFTMLGPRVPAVVISPFVPAGAVDMQIHDHASVPATLRALFAPDAQPLTSRDRWAAPFHGIRTLEEPRRADLPNLSGYVAAQRPPAGRLEAEPPTSALPSEDPEDVLDHYQPFEVLANSIAQHGKALGEPEFAALASTTQPELLLSAEISQAFAMAAQRHRSADIPGGPYTLDLNSLFGHARSTVRARPDIIAQLDEFSDPPDLASAIDKQADLIQAGITDLEGRTRKVGERLSALLATIAPSNTLQLEEQQDLIVGERDLQNAIEEIERDLSSIRSQPERDKLANQLLSTESYRKDLEKRLDTGSAQRTRRHPVLSESEPTQREQLSKSPVILTARARTEQDECRRLIARIEHQSLEARLPYLRGNREFRARETEWKSLLSDITDALQAAMLSVALTALNTARKEATKPYMKVKLLAGLKQLTIDNPVRTETFDKLEAKIQQRGHGSFGIAGPRGVGKTTLIGFFAKSSPGRLGVIVPAPVSYEARDFVLHLYSKLCKEAAKEAAKTLDKNKAWPTPDEGWPREQAESPSSVREIGIAVFGSSAVTGGIFLLTWAIVQRFSSFAPRLSDVGAALLAAAASILLVLLLRNLHVFNAVRFARPVIKAFGAEPPLNRERFLVEQPYSKPHDQGPLVRKRRIFIWVCVAVSALATMGIMLIVTNHGWGSSSRTLAGGLGLALLATGIPALAFLINAARPVKVGSASVPSPSPANDDTSSGDRELYEAAYSHLEWIQFQHSFGGEQSSTVKISGPSIIPLGMDIGGKRSADLTQQPSSYPEIVDDLRGFLSIAAKTRQVVIGVDELDKMRTPEDVQSFLNNIKGIFVAADCFYLVSISEDAAANFERRGSPFRDAFDSAFDEVISLEYFDMTDARKILYGLLFGWTEPFVGLCYVLSGGLVRDLLRCVYELVGYRNKDDVIELSDAALALCRREVSGRVQAIRYQLVCDPFAANVELLERIADLHPEEASARAFLTWHNDFLNGVNKTVSEDVSLSLSDIAPADGAESMADTRQAATEYPMASKPGMPGQNATRLALELTASLLFAATVLEFFDPAKISERLEDSGTMSPGPKSLATLAAARQALAQSPSVSLMLIERFRSAWKLGHLEGADAP